MWNERMVQIWPLGIGNFFIAFLTSGLCVKTLSDFKLVLVEHCSYENIISPTELKSASF